MTIRTRLRRIAQGWPLWSILLAGLVIVWWGFILEDITAPSMFGDLKAMHDGVDIK